MINPVRFFERLLGQWNPPGATPTTVPMSGEARFHRPSSTEELRELPRRPAGEDEPPEDRRR